MTYGAFTSREFADLHPTRRHPLPQAALCAVALMLGASATLWGLYGQPPVASPEAVKPIALRRTEAPVAAAIPEPPRANPFVALLDPALTAGYVADTFARSAPLTSAFQTTQVAAAEMSTDADPEPEQVAAAEPAPVVPPAPVASNLVRDVPMPMPRPAALARLEETTLPHAGRRAVAALMPRSAEPAVTPANPGGFFDRFFGSARPTNPALAYAATEEGSLGPAALSRPGAPDRWTAVYNIATHTVTLPDGSRLEAHSGLGANKDNPSSVAVHMRGATPPAVYDLTPREALFHGVRALRLNPVGDVPPYGRMGLLAHTYMLGPRGDSNGCVVFRDYAAFRRAYDSGMVRRLVVVAGL